MNVELINMGTEKNPQHVNLQLGCSPFERMAFINFPKQHNDFFSWSYDDIKTFDTSIIQHTIPMLSEEKPVQQKLRKIHPNIESQIKNELNKQMK
jgi:Mg2+ and Co2+ transporter CorA